MKITLPYGKNCLTAEVPDNNLIGIYNSQVEEFQPEFNAIELVKQALDQPIDSPPLEELAVGKSQVVIITSDHTRPVPSKIIMAQLLQRIRCGNPKANITILVATGYHRPSSQQELIDKLGQEIVANEHIN